MDVRFWEPKVQGLPHLAAITQVRLWVEQAIWRSERQLTSEQPFTRRQMQLSHRPAAEVLIDTQTVTIEVERSAKTPLQLPAMRYDLAQTSAGNARKRQRSQSRCLPQGGGEQAELFPIFGDRPACYWDATSVEQIGYALIAQWACFLAHDLFQHFFDTPI